MPFSFTPLKIPEVILIEARQFGDDRGFFMETYHAEAFRQNGIDVNFVQDNFSHSAKGVIRGLHYQTNPMAQGKLVMAAEGEVFDVAVDIRRGSPTYGQWVGEVLSTQNGRLLWVPPGFAHGFCVISETANVSYKVTELYSPDCDSGIRWDDPTINVHWPVDGEPLLSPKDSQHPFLEDANNNFVY